jgi:two-component system alkaline phosphatase synthesis response regulator PhoP
MSACYDLAMKHKYGYLKNPGPRPQIRIDKERFEVWVDGTLIPLSSILFDLFIMICEADGRIVTRDMVMKEIYNWPKDVLSKIETRTIDQHIRRLRVALGKRHLIQTVPGRGYKLVRY